MDSSEMFIITVVALAIVGALCLGLLLIIALILGQKRVDGIQSINPQGMAHHQNTPEQTQTVTDKLDKLDKEIDMGTFIGMSGLSLAVILYSGSLTIQNVWHGIVGYISAAALFILGLPESRKFIARNPKRGMRFMWGFFGCVITLTFVSIFWRV